jgi:hypothetical protein
LRKLLACKLFRKNLIATFPEESLTKGSTWRDQTAQRLQLSGCGSKLAPSEENVKNKEMAGI